MPYTLEQIGARAKERNPELSKFSDSEIGDRLVKRNPELSKMVSTPTQGPTPAVGSTLSQPQAPEKPKEKEGGIMEGLAKLGHALGGTATGALKEAYDIPRQAAQLGTAVGEKLADATAPITKPILSPIAKILPQGAVQQASQDLKQGVERQEYTKPQGTAEKVGQFAMQGAELFAPGLGAEKLGVGIANKALKMIPRQAAMGPKALPKLVRGAVGVGSRATAEAGIFAGQTALTTGGQDPEAIKSAAKLGAAFPIAGAALKGAANVAKPVMGKTAEATINSLIKPLLKDFSYGKNPGRGVAAEGIVANSLEELAGKIFDRKVVRGKEIGEKVAHATAQGRTIDLPNFTGPIDEALEQARKAPRTNEALIKRLEDTKKDILGVKENVMGGQYPTRSFFGLTPDEVWKFKQDIYDITKFTGNASDDKVVNMALKKMGGKAKQALNDAVPGLAPLNERFADLSSAQIATIYRDKIEARQNLLKLAPKLAAGAGVIGGVMSGNLDSVIGGLVLAGADRIAASAALKTRLAKVLASMSGDDLAKAYSKTPALKSIVERVFGKDARKLGEVDFAPGPGASGSQMVGKEVPLGKEPRFGGFKELTPAEKFSNTVNQIRATKGDSDLVKEILVGARRDLPVEEFKRLVREVSPEIGDDVLKSLNLSKGRLVSPLEKNFASIGQQKITDPAKFSRAKYLSSAEDKQLEEAAFNHVLKNEDAILKQYTDKFGNEVNPDEFRNFFKELGYKGTNSAAVQEPSSYLAKRLRTELLAKNPGKYSMYTAGMSGSGKTTALKKFADHAATKSEAAVILDSNFSEYESVMKKLQEDVNMGKEPIVDYVYREYKDAYWNGIIKRMLNPESGGRVVPNSVTAANTVGSWKVPRQVEDWHGVKVRYRDNSFGPNGAVPTTREALEKKIKYPSVAVIKNQLDQLAKKALTNGTPWGRISPEQYQALIQ